MRYDCIEAAEYLCAVFQLKSDTCDNIGKSTKSEQKFMNMKQDLNQNSTTDVQETPPPKFVEPWKIPNHQRPATTLLLEEPEQSPMKNELGKGY